MALSKALVAALAVAVLALLTLTAAAPAAEASADAATAAYDALRLEGLSGMADAPALAGLSDHAIRHRCRSYFQCYEKKVEVLAKHTYPCVFAAVTAPLIKGLPPAPLQCRKDPYDCKPAKCGGWYKCRCDVCRTVTLAYPVWCEQ